MLVWETKNISNERVNIAKALDSAQKMLNLVQGKIFSDIPGPNKEFPIPGRMTISAGVAYATDFSIAKNDANVALTFAKK